MKRFLNILYIYDVAPSTQQDPVSDRVADLARRNGADVTLIRILPDTILEQLGPRFFSRIETLVASERQQHHEALVQECNHHRWQGIRVNSELLRGKDFVATIQKVLRDAIDLVVKARSSEKGGDHFAMRLFRKCPCPVWVIDATRTMPSPPRVLGTVDLSTETETNRHLNQKIVELTSSLAALVEGEAHLLYAWHLEHENTLRGPRFKFADAEISAMKDEILENGRENLRRLLSACEIELPRESIHLVEGPPEEVIRNIHAAMHIEVLIMGTLARTGLPGLLIGNKAEAVLSQIGGTVLAVKPNGFVSPVTL
jgi:universal stress protein E